MEAPKELNTKVYTMKVEKEKALNQWLNEQLKARLIVESKLRYIWYHVFTFQRKMVQNYRKLNQVTIKDKMPLPLIGKVVNKLKEAKYFNKLDFIWGYNNV